MTPRVCSRQYEHGQDGIQKTDPALQPVTQAILPGLHSEPVDVERGRSEELERWRGFPSALDDMWSDVRSTATPRGWWQAIDQYTGQGLGEMVGARQEAVFVRWQARRQLVGSTQFATAGWGVDARQFDAAQHHVGQENTHETSSDGHIPILSREACLAASAS